MENFRYITVWSNLNVWRDSHSMGISTPWGNLILKPLKNRLFSERNGLRPAPPQIKFRDHCLSWVRLRETVAAQDASSSNA